jgi:hypothetical protein
MKWFYPAENRDPWFDDFESFVEGLDVSGYASREDRNIVIGGGGTISWDVGTSLLTWTSDILIVSPLLGFLLRVGSGSVSLDEGQFFYAVIVRAPTGNTVLSVGVVNQVPSDDTSFVLAVRIGDRIHWRNGTVQDDAEQLNGIGAKQGRTGLQSSIDLPRYDYTQLGVPVEDVIGQFMFDGSKIPSGASVYLRCMMNPVFSGPGYAAIRFYDLGPIAGPPAGPVEITAAAPSPYGLEVSASGLVYLQTSALVVSSAPGTGQIVDAARMYEATVIQSSVAGDSVNVGMASIFTEIE